MMIDVYFSSSHVSVKVQKKGETREIKMQRDILRKSFRSSFDANSCINVENLFIDPLGPLSLALGCLFYFYLFTNLFNVDNLHILRYCKKLKIL